MLHRLADDAAASPHEHNNIAGRAWELNFNAVLSRAWPALGRNEESAQARRAFNAYLRETENAACLRFFGQRGGLWWVADTWNELPPPVRPGLEEKQVLHRGPKVTPAEAGEDRVPAEVQTAWACSCGESFATREERDQHEEGHLPVREAQPGTLVADARAILGSGYSIHLDELAFLLEESDPGKYGKLTVKSLAAALREQGAGVRPVGIHGKIKTGIRRVDFPEPPTGASAPEPAPEPEPAQQEDGPDLVEYALRLLEDYDRLKKAERGMDPGESAGEIARLREENAGLRASNEALRRENQAYRLVMGDR